MRYYIVRLLSVFFFVFCILFPAVAPAHAADNFTTNYSVIYSVADDANTHAVFSITLTNTSDQYYASSYKMQLGFDKIEHITARDEGGVIQPTVSKTNEGQTVELEFNKRVVGDGKSMHFTLAFDTPDVAKQNGAVWEINIPGIKNKEDFSSFTAEVKVPKDFGTPTYIKPIQPNNSLTFSKEQLETSGISIAFGNRQLYTFHLTYHLKNTNVFPIKTEIALPPDTNYQSVAIASMNPAPSNVTIDPDGNWLASYSLLPSQKKDIVVTGTAALNLEPAASPLTAKQQKAYTADAPYWQVKSPAISDLGQKLKTPEDIYNYVVKTLNYDFTRVAASQQRFGAEAILKQPTAAVCREFTDLFVALARAAGIPAREVNGFAFTENAKQRPLSLVKDVLHAWPEYYDTARNRWVMVDPTWGNTTGGVDYFHVLDFDHFAFVLKGLDSEYPIPAGGYKSQEDENKKDVDVTFSTSQVIPDAKAEVTTHVANQFLSAVPVTGTITVKNIGHTVSNQTALSIVTQFLTPRVQQLTVPAIPPYGIATIPFTFDKTPLLTNKTDTLTMRIADAQFRSIVRISPFVITKEVVIGGILIVLFALILFVIALKAGRLPFLR